MGALTNQTYKMRERQAYGLMEKWMKKIEASARLGHNEVEIRQDGFGGKPGEVLTYESYTREQQHAIGLLVHQGFTCEVFKPDHPFATYCLKVTW